VSSYSFSEIDNSFQQNYIKHLFPKITHGFIVWNFIKLYDFGKDIISITKEIPWEAENVLYVYF
jgi:hypothetical protein